MNLHDDYCTCIYCDCCIRWASSESCEDSPDGRHHREAEIERLCGEIAKT